MGTALALFAARGCDPLFEALARDAPRASGGVVLGFDGAPVPGADEAAADAGGPDGTYLPPGRRILVEEAAAAGVSVTELVSVSRQRALVLVRHRAMYRMAVETELSTPQIGRVCGRRDHTSVLYGIAKHCERNGLRLPRAMTTTIAQRRPTGW